MPLKGTLYIALFINPGLRERSNYKIWQII